MKTDPTAASPRLQGRGTGRLVTLALALLCLTAIGAVLLSSWWLGTTGLRADFGARLLPPSPAHPFGTDAMGRDMLARTVKGLAASLWVGALAATISSLLALLLALASLLGRGIAAAVSFITDAALGLPHLVLLILLAFAFGGGTTAVVLAVALTHWPRLTRILRAELMQVQGSAYVETARAFGKSWRQIARHHVLPHLVPQLIVGLVLLFPHAILHEAGLTFLGFGMEPSKPAIGILLSDAMRYVSAGKWWLGVTPGLCLLVVVLCFDAIGAGARLWADPRTGQD